MSNADCCICIDKCHRPKLISLIYGQKWLFIDKFPIYSTDDVTLYRPVYEIGFKNTTFIFVIFNIGDIQFFKKVICFLPTSPWGEVHPSRHAMIASFEFWSTQTWQIDKYVSGRQQSQAIAREFSGKQLVSLAYFIQVHKQALTEFCYFLSVMYTEHISLIYIWKSWRATHGSLPPI